jgi:hypothetical protein
MSDELDVIEAETVNRDDWQSEDEIQRRCSRFHLIQRFYPRGHYDLSQPIPFQRLRLSASMTNRGEDNVYT